VAKQIESFTMFLRVTNAEDVDPDNWVITRVGCDHQVGESTVAGVRHPKTAECPLLVLDAATKGLKNTAGTVLKHAQDTRAAIEAAEGI